MLVIRLARTGRKKYPTYRVVAADSRRPVTGKFVSILGHYNPHTKELVLKKEEIVEMVNKGAQPSNSLIRLLESQKVELPEWVKYHSRNKASKQEAEEKPEEPKAESAPVEGEEALVEVAEQPEAAGAEVAAEQAAEVSENVKDEEVTETAASDQAEADKAEKAGDIAAEAAVEAASEDTEQA